MSKYPNITDEPELLKIKTKDDEFKNLNIKWKNMIMRMY